MRVLGLRFPGRRASRRPSYDARRAIVYLHVPKTSGSAVTTGLVSAVAPLRFQPAYDRTGYGGFDGFGSMAPEMKRHLYLDIADLPGGSDFVAGHCAFSTFWTKYRDAQFVSFLREPVSRLLSFWLFPVPCCSSHGLLLRLLFVGGRNLRANSEVIDLIVAPRSFAGTLEWWRGPMDSIVRP